MEPIHVVIDSTSWWPNVIAILISLAVAVFTGIQLLIRQVQARAALFPRRFAVYKTAWDAVQKVRSGLVDTEAEWEAEADLVTSWHEAQFLFSKGQNGPVAQKLQALRSPMMELIELKKELAEESKAYKGKRRTRAERKARNELIKKRDAAKDRLHTMQEALPEVFRPWLKISWGG